MNTRYKDYDEEKGYKIIYRNQKGLLITVSFNTLASMLQWISNFYVTPVKDLMNTRFIPKTFLIDSKNYIDIQPDNYQCAAFSSAYVLRYFGVEAEGRKLYKSYPYKYPDGTVSPKGIVTFFKNRGYAAEFYKGNIATLKKQVSRGVPVIAFTKTSPNKRSLHFVPVVGYDEKYLYLADSLRSNINCDEKNYNRKISIKDFEKIWRIGISSYDNTYLVIHK